MPERHSSVLLAPCFVVLCHGETCSNSISLVEIYFQIQGSNTYPATFGEEGDISNLCQFAWYEWVYFYDNSPRSHFPSQKDIIGQCLGPAKNEGYGITQWFIKKN